MWCFRCRSSVHFESNSIVTTKLKEKIIKQSFSLPRCTCAWYNLFCLFNLLLHVDLPIFLRTQTGRFNFQNGGCVTSRRRLLDCPTKLLPREKSVLIGRIFFVCTHCRILEVDLSITIGSLRMCVHCRGDSNESVRTTGTCTVTSTFPLVLKNLLHWVLRRKEYRLLASSPFYTS